MNRLPRLVATALRPRLPTNPSLTRSTISLSHSHNFSTTISRFNNNNGNAPWNPEDGYEFDGPLPQEFLDLPPEIRAHLLKQAESLQSSSSSSETALSEWNGAEEDDDSGNWTHALTDQVEYPDGVQRSGRFHYNLPFPDVNQPNPLYDMDEVHEFPPVKGNGYHNRIVIRNDPSIFKAADEMHPWDEDLTPQEREEELRRREAKAVAEAEAARNASNSTNPLDSRRKPKRGKKEEDEDDVLSNDKVNPRNFLPLSLPQRRNLHIYPLIVRRVVQQTGLGKMPRTAVHLVIGNANGLVGLGEGKHSMFARAMNRAYCEAIRNMDYIHRFEDRTIWTEMESKFGSTRLILRPRPVGFGLHCNPYVHQIAKAAGIKDMSAKVWGSRNPLNVIKLMFRMMQPGSAPVGMGDGVGGRGRRLDKGVGVRGKQEVERERGRRLYDLRTY